MQFGLQPSARGDRAADEAVEPVVVRTRKPELPLVDHAAAAGSPRETGNTLHRIDPDIVVSELTEAGFVLDGTSDLLRNTTDDLSLNMADPSIRGRTDRFVMRFRKPE